jgi:D-serine deaminase-like pyridoxal phosphate-dependent protein
MLNAPSIGCPLDELDTPALCIDLDVMEGNIARMAAMCREHRVGWRPHTKAMKTPELGRRLIAAGALGVTCAKLGEAEVMADGGIRDILIANQIVGPLKLRRLAELCRRADPVVAVDHADQVQAIGQAMHAAGVRVRLLVEVDIGLKRAGVPPGDAAVRLGRLAASTPGIELAGIMGYEGHLLTLEDAGEKAQAIRQAMAVLVACRDDFLRAGLPCPIVSAGGTGSCAFTVACPGVTELQAGGLIFMDAFYRHKCGVTAFDFALKLLCTVVSRPTPGRAIIDAGRKSVHADLHVPLVIDHEQDIRVMRLSAEHGELQLDEPAQKLKIGDRLWLIPGYSDMTNVLHNEFYAIRRGRLEAIWPLVGRGRLQ